MRVQDRPRWKASAGVLFDDFAHGRRGGAGARPVGPLAVELPPARRGRGRADDGGARRQGAAGARLRVGRPPGRRLAGARARAGPRPRRRGARVEGGRASGDSVGTWRNAFVQAPYLRDSFVAGGVISETFETAITWDRLGGVRPGGARARRARGGRDLRRRARDLPVHARLPGRRRRRTSRCWRRRAAAARSSSGTRSRRRCQTRDRSAAGRSPTTTRSGATTGPGTTVSGRTRSPRRWRAPSARSTRAGTSIPACCWTPRAEPDAAAEHRLGHAVRLDLVAAALDPRAELVQAGGCLRCVAHRVQYLARCIGRICRAGESRAGQLAHDPRMSPKKRELGRADRIQPGIWRLRLPLPWTGVPARERLRHRRGQRRRAGGHGNGRAGGAGPARARARPGRPAARARPPARLHPRALRPLRPGRADRRRRRAASSGCTRTTRT